MLTITKSVFCFFNYMSSQLLKSIVTMDSKFQFEKKSEIFDILAC